MEESFFFSTDGDGHWHMIPARLRGRWEELISADEDDDDANNALEIEFRQYRTGGGIGHIEFIPTKRDR